MIKTQRIYYTARNFATGLSDVSANIYRNGALVAQNVALSEVSATLMPGVYALELLAAGISGYGGAGTYVARINSASPASSAPAVAKFDVLVNNEDDLELHLVSIETKLDTANTSLSSITTELASVKATGTSTNNVITDPMVGNANIKALVESAISAIQTVQNNTSFVAVVSPQLVVPAAGSKHYEIAIRIFDSNNQLEDPDTNTIAVSIKNEFGLDRTNLLTGYTAGPVNATRISQGVYQIGLDVTSTSGLEQLLIEFAYSEGGSSLNHVRTAETVADVQATGFALQATLLDVLADTSDMQPRVQSILTLVQDPTHGLAALKALIDVIDGVVDANNAILTSGTYGLAGLKNILDTKSSQVSVDAIASALLNDVKGAGFDNAKDSLKQISDRSFFGGSAV